MKSRKSRKAKSKKTDFVARAVNVLRKGGVIIYPTETVYGLGAGIRNSAAVRKIYSLKGRETTKALLIAVADTTGIEKYAEVNETAKQLADEYLPGPLALVLPKKKTVPEHITRNAFVGIRVPENETARKIIEKFGDAIVSTSANISGGKDPTKVSEIPKKIRSNVDLVIDEGQTKYKGASTIVQVLGNEVKVLRQGVKDIWSRGRVC